MSIKDEADKERFIRLKGARKSNKKLSIHRLGTIIQLAEELEIGDEILIRHSENIYDKIYEVNN